MKCEKHINVHAPHCPICADEERDALLRVARAAKEMTDIHHVSGGVRVCPVTTQILDALKELPEGLLD